MNPTQPENDLEKALEYLKYIEEHAAHLSSIHPSMYDHIRQALSTALTRKGEGTMHSVGIDAMIEAPVTPRPAQVDGLEGIERGIEAFKNIQADLLKTDTGRTVWAILDYKVEECRRTIEFNFDKLKASLAVQTQVDVLGKILRNVQGARNLTEIDTAEGHPVWKYLDSALFMLRQEILAAQTQDSGNEGWRPIKEAPIDVLFVCRCKDKPHVTFEAQVFLESENWEMPEEYKVLQNMTTDEPIDGDWTDNEWKAI